MLGCKYVFAMDSFVGSLVMPKSLVAGIGLQVAVALWHLLPTYSPTSSYSDSDTYLGGPFSLFGCYTHPSSKG